MALDRVHRELAVILHADVAGYSRLMERNEDVVHQRVTECFDRLTCVIEQFRGTVTERRGDAVLARFDRPSDGVLAAASYQRSERELLEARDGPCPQVRIGLNLGEVIADQGTLWGTGVNLAQRVEQLAEPGGICVSSTVRDAISKALPIEYDDLGEQWVKDTRLHAYRARLRAGEDIISPPPASAAQVAAPIFDKPSLTVLPFVNVGGDPEQEYFADGVTEDIIGAMSHLRWLFVVGRNSAFTYKGKATDVRQVGRELRVRSDQKRATLLARGSHGTSRGILREVTSHSAVRSPRLRRRRYDDRKNLQVSRTRRLAREGIRV